MDLKSKIMPDNIELNVEKSVDQESFDSQQLIVFKLGQEEYGIEIDQIKEVVLTPNITQMPQTPDYVKGVANIRGNIIGIIDLEEKFGIKKGLTTKEINEASNYTLVVESDTFKIGVLVTEVPNTLNVRVSDIERSVDIVHDKNVDSDYIEGIVKLESRLVILINIFKVLREDEMEEIETAQNEVG